MLKGIKNIVFDLGGVLVDLDSQRCIDAFDALGCQQTSEYVHHHRTEDLFYDIELGLTGQDQFCHEVRRMCGCHATDADIVAAWNSLLHPMSEVKKARLLQLRQNYRIFLLSNTNCMHWEWFEHQLRQADARGASAYFERTYLSHLLHMVKPDANIFKYVLDDAGLKAEQTLFIDDNADNCQSARSLGIRTLLQSNENNWMEQL